jgi:transcriptional regulator with XRE-family HTH domain
MSRNKEKPLFARNLAYLRYQKRFTIRKVTELTGINMSTWSTWETGRCFPSLLNIPVVCEALGYYDVYGMMTRDLSSSTDTVKVNRLKAIEGLTEIKHFLETLKE